MIYNFLVIHLCFYDRLIAYDHNKKSFQLITLQLNNDTETPQQKLAFLETLLDKARDIRVPTPESADIENADFAKIHSNMTRDYYLRAFEKIKRHIYDGDVYQINFSQLFLLANLSPGNRPLSLAEPIQPKSIFRLYRTRAIFKS